MPLNLKRRLILSCQIIATSRYVILNLKINCKNGITSRMTRVYVRRYVSRSHFTLDLAEAVPPCIKTLYHRSNRGGMCQKRQPDGRSGVKCQPVAA